ncbi:hypothetical protein SAICODRAFT_22959 [Saitoella complicata NRRL Y-17804]|uniref:uncharacterized protein n=1 Tax=Saitoella complicata (strain BCRC 22490 / CBS 7301 / JCM 7358 / NBRC 10748 / NRRL Y-17804) TaxID=698492 RepID=UPI0008671E4F|nr:uncharacterized protein SAICODRAFT_22959 [Saitoella complicata NRRL Y-17804]ODQ56615.1 hypothetical protein SAICODRAFT_22959 [Saitoella complicata NRRL Y-17804]
MKLKPDIISYILFTTAAVGGVRALKFPHRDLPCGTVDGGDTVICPRGQICELALSPSLKTCHPSPPTLLQPRSAPVTYSTDGSCGPANGNTVCDPNAMGYTGTCCSEYGWCGDGDAYCAVSNGCHTGFGTCTMVPTTDGTCGPEVTCQGWPQGECCSEYGWCGDTDAHCLVANGCQSGCADGSSPTSTTTMNMPPATSTAAAPASTMKATTDGTCGPDVSCEGWPQGTCCSEYGWCGNTDAHCLVSNGCQNGCTDGSLTTISSTSTAPATTMAVTTDGTCGPDVSCEGWPEGTCCSQYGYCGNTDAHCLVSNGCQNGCISPSFTSTSPTTSASSISGSTALPSGYTYTTDGSCGGTVMCGDWPQGGCCSQYGYCGDTDLHCLTSNGCQLNCTDSTTSGPTSSSTATGGEGTISGPQGSGESASPDASVTTDGTCGAMYNYTVCGDWAGPGSCCSMYGFCGDTSAHCGAGCQSGNCTSEPDTFYQPVPAPQATGAAAGSFEIVGMSGAPAMHAGVMPNGKVIFLDKVENYTQVKLSDGQYAYSTEYDLETNTYLPLQYETNAFCSGGAFLPNGVWVSVGGNAPLSDIDPTVGDGFTGIRYLDRTDDSHAGQPWSEPGNKLSTARWYPTVQTLPDGRLFVCSGSLNGLDPTVSSNNNPTWEVLSAEGISTGESVPMDLLIKAQPYYMYPFIHVLKSGNLFVFASKSSEIFDVDTNATVKSLPDLSGDYRTYPNTGSSALLALSSANNWESEIVICGGGAYQDTSSPSDPSCGRIKPEDDVPVWEMDSMPEGRVMGEWVMLPTGDLILLNGCKLGAQGFGLGRAPDYGALLYQPSKPLGSRWTSLASSTIERLYHSVALLLPDATVMVSGSNPVEQPMLEPDAANPYVTRFEVEIFTPFYGITTRPVINSLSSSTITPGGDNFTMSVNVPAGASPADIKVSLYHEGFVTHSVHMGTRLLFLDITVSKDLSTIEIAPPPSLNVAPPGPYMVFLIVDGAPSVAEMVMVG